MSLINKMLQDLDARQNGAREASSLYTKPVARLDKRPSPVMIASMVVAVGALAVAGAIGWRYWHKQHAPAAVASSAVEMKMPTGPVPMTKPAAPAHALPTQTAPQAVDKSSVPTPTSPAAPADAVEPHEPEARAPAPKAHKPAAKKDKQHKATADKAEHGQSARKERVSHTAAPAVAAKAPPAVQGRVESANQKADASYRHALASMQDGYVSEAVSELNRALQLNPHHDGARQTLISLLIENHRTDEAMRQLQLGLTLDPKQPSLAMLLARLQIERGGNGIETLMRTLPFVGDNGEYRAFLAGALQRQQRHREAIEQYQLALRSMPQNGVWLMGLGISLQAEKRDGEALDAFRKARSSGTLNPQLAAFVDNKIQQLSH